MILLDATENLWEKRWFVLRRFVLVHTFTLDAHNRGRPYLHMYKSSSELDEVGVINLAGAKIESDPTMDDLFGVWVPVVPKFACC